MTPEARRERAWALKAEAYAAWHTEPPQARVAAEALAALAEGQADPELQALAAWTAGIGALAAGELPAALQALEAAQACFEQAGDLQHAAETQVPQMVALAMSGRAAEALARGEAALQRFMTTGDLRSAAKVEGNLGTMLSRQDRHAEAEQRWRRAALHFARAGDAESSVAADVALAYSLAFQFRLDEALAVNERARHRAAQRGLAILEAQALHNIGRIELHRGGWHRALAVLAEAAERLAAAGAPPLRRLEAEMALADAYLGVNLLQEAVALYEPVIAQAQAAGAETEAAWATLQCARARERLGDGALAAAGYAAARALYERLDNPACLAWCDLAQARLMLAEGGDAGPAANAAAAALQAAGMPGWRLEAELVAAGAAAARGDSAAARSAYAAVRDGAAALGPLRLAAEAGLGRLAARAGDRAGARRALESVLDAIDRQRAALPDDEFRSALAHEAAQVHADLVALAWAEGDSARLLEAIDRGRARALLMSLPAERQATAEGTRLRWLREQWREAMAEGDLPRLPALGDALAGVEAELAEAWRRSRLARAAVPDDAAGAGDAPDPAPLVPTLQATLDDDTAMLVWHRDGERLLACIATHGGVVHRELRAAGLDEELQALRFQIDTLRHGGALLRRHGGRLMARVQQHAQALHRRLWTPLEADLDGRRRIVLVPHRELHYLPWAALHDGRQWLVERHALSLAASARAWLRPLPPAHDGPVLALGLTAGGLPQVADELAAVAAVHGARARLRLDAEASTAAFRAEAPDAALLHLACHGVFRADNPAFSHLRLADGPLSLHDLQGLALRARLVVLSACETGLSRMAPGDELLGLVRAFTRAGAGAVLATLWSVDDGASALLLADLHAALQAGVPADQALQQAQAAAAAAGEHPFHWAAHVLHGRG